MTRKYQNKQNRGGVNDSLVNTMDGAQEYNSPRQEIENAVASSGQERAEANGLYLVSGNPEDLNQLAKGMFIYSLAATNFIDSGTLNNYILTPSNSSLKFPKDLSGDPAFDNFDLLAAATITFQPANSNDGPSTLNIGQDGGALLGAKPLLKDSSPSPLPLSAGDLVVPGRYQAYYDAAADSGNGAWILVNRFFSGIPVSYKYIKITRQYASGVDGGAYNPNPAASWIKLDLNTLVLDETGLVNFTSPPEFSLPIGRYRIQASTCGDDVGTSRLALGADVGDPPGPTPNIILISQNGGGGDGGIFPLDNFQTILDGFFEVSDIGTDYSLLFRALENDADVWALGGPSGDNPEIYTTIILTKIS